ncbi:MAG: vanadium-dependent haloperoxidase [Verrucomicrobiota bacterium]
MPTRRQFLYSSSTALAGGLLAGCAAPHGSSRSYLTDLVPTGETPSADAFWTDVMFQAVRDQAIGPPLAARIYAIGHLAGFLSLTAGDRKYHQPFPELGSAPSGISKRAAYAAAVAQAAAEPLQTPLGVDLARFLNRLDEPGVEVEAGAAWGRDVGNFIQRKRAVDGGHAEKVRFYFDPEYTPRKTVDSWSHTGPYYRTEIGPRFETYERGLFPNLGNMIPFAIQSRTQYAAAEFLDVRSKEFADQYAEVRELGGTNSTSRTDDEFEIAFFWEDGPRGGTVPAALIHIALRLFEQEKGQHSLTERAQLLAQMSCAMADGGLSAWHSKYYYDVFRPETAIRHTAEKLGNPDPRVKRERGWTSLIPTPPFPAYVSGHSTFAGAGAEVLKQWFGTDHKTFSVRALDTVNWPKQISGSTRHYTNFTTVADENGLSRIYGGVHWQHDNIEGLKMGRAIGRHVHHNFLNRV